MSDDKKILQQIRKYPWDDSTTEITLFDTYVQALVMAGYKATIPKTFEIAEKFIQFRELYIKKKNLN